MTEKSDPANSCDSEFDPNSLSVEQALQRIIDASPLPDAKNNSNIESLAIMHCYNRVLAENIHSTINVPGHTNSAMDGYAVISSDLPRSGEKKLHVVCTVFAGKPVTTRIQAGQCARIMTGGAMPAGTDTVIMQEHVQRSEDSIIIQTGHSAGQNVRQAGEDVHAGQCVLSAGKRMQAAEMGLLASVGISTVKVFRRVKVAFFSTGDELVGVGQTLQPGQIYDSNRYTLHGLLQQFDAEIIDLGVVPDQPQAVEDALRNAAKQADVLITTGGVSVGEADYVKSSLEKLGRVDFWKIAMKPGRPLAFGSIDKCAFFGLPGNPVSSMVTFLQFVLPALRRRSGEQQTQALTMQATCMDELRKRPGRMEFQRGIASWNEQSGLVVSSFGKQDSHLLTSMSRANAFILLPLESSGAKAGEKVNIQLFAGIL